MRPRAGTRPVTLEPSRVIEILSLSRAHDDLLKETRQDLFRAETKLRVERKWRWPLRIVFAGLGAGVLALAQNEVLMGNFGQTLLNIGEQMQAAGTVALVVLVGSFCALFAAAYLLRRALAKPSPNQQARKLMEQFAEKDGVAAYVFTEETADDMAASIGALTREENKNFRQRHLTASNRTLQSQMHNLLNRTVEDTQTLLH